MERTEDHAVFGGRQQVWQHRSSSLNCDMKFAIFLPQQALQGRPCPVLYWLSGLTCNEQNFITKSAFHAHAARLGMVVVAPDTSPRGENVADDAAWDLGQGAGFYVNATQAPWAAHYRMQDYVSQELPTLIEKHFPVTDKRSISGHSMGGHGALVTAFRHPGRYASVSAFAPIVAPMQVPWGQKAFSAYLGDDQESWKDWDAVQWIARAREVLPLLVDQGDADNFLQEQLRPQLLAAACKANDYPLQLRMQPAYDHSYYFISTFIGDHFDHHDKALRS